MTSSSKQLPTLSFCSHKFVILHKKFLKGIDDSDPTHWPKIHYYKWIVPPKCSGYCKKLIFGNDDHSLMVYPTQLLKNINIVNHLICRDLFYDAYCIST